MDGWTRGCDVAEAGAVTETIGQAATQARVTEARRFWRVFMSRSLVRIGMVIIVALIITAIFAPILAPYDPYAQDLSQTLANPNTKHWLGTDSLGRDTLSRIIYGSRTSLMVGLVAVVVAAAIGMTLGLIAGYYGGWINPIIMRFVDGLLAFPMILLALAVAALLGGGIRNVIIALGVSLVPVYARLMCGQALTVKENDYVTAARAIGASNARIMLVHVLPNCFPPLIVLMTMMMGMAILAEAGLSFLGLGIKPPGAAWGAMVSDGYQLLLTNPILAFAPGVAIMLTVFAFNMVGDGLRDALDPRLRGTL
ncbi:MAG: ABC transporter permease [Chloroflexi bacterium]|nr:ABC transporter permease [Chloroflexota bacterium]